MQIVPVADPSLYVIVCVYDVLYRVTVSVDVLPIFASVAPRLDFSGVAVATTDTFPVTVFVLPDVNVDPLTVCVVIE